MYDSRLLLVVAALALSACQPKAAAPGTAGPGPETSVDHSPPVAVVNGAPISRNFFESYIRAIAKRPSSELTPEQRSHALDNLIKTELVSQQATRNGLDKAPDTAALLELTRLNVLQQAETDQYLKDKKPTEQQVRAEYENQVAGMSKQEYHAKHILVATEPFAQKVIAQLDKGAKFEDVARRESMDSSKDNGGDIGWFTPEKMVKPFAEAVVALKPGQYTHKPVQTQYGWHVIELVEVRDLQPPPFDNVRQQLEQVVQAKKLNAYADELMRNAKVEKKLDQAKNPS